MALIKCSECGKEVEDNIKSCPNCGMPITKEKTCKNCGNKMDENQTTCKKCGTKEKTKDNKKIIIIIAIIVVIFIFISLIISSSKKNNSSVGGNGNYYKPSDNNTYEEEEITYETLSVSKDVSKEVKGSYNDEEIKAEITIKGVYWTTKLTPPSPQQSYYSYYEATQDEVYQVVEMVVKNTGTESFSDYVFEGFLSDYCTPTFTYDGGYKYTGISLVELEQDSRGKYDLGNFYSISPLTTKTIYAIKKVPKDVTDKSLNINLCFGDNKLEINW